MDIPIIGPSWQPGDRVDFVPQPGCSYGPGGTHGSHDLPKDHLLSSFDKAIQEGQGVRKKATVDRVITNPDGTTTLRLILDDGLEFAWAPPQAVEPLDSVSRLGDVLGRRDLKDVLNEMEDERPVCADCEQPIEGLVHWCGNEARCDSCRNKKLGLP